MLSEHICLKFSFFPAYKTIYIVYKENYEYNDNGYIYTGFFKDASDHKIMSTTSLAANISEVTPIIEAMSARIFGSVENKLATKVIMSDESHKIHSRLLKSLIGLFIYFSTLFYYDT